MCGEERARGADARAASSASDSEKCVGCGRSRSASSTSTSRSSSSGQDASGMRLQSVRYAKRPKRKPRIGRVPCQSGTGCDFVVAERRTDP